MFMAFVTIKIQYHKLINVIASATFGVYLLHENGIIRPLLWKTVLVSTQYQNSLLLIPYSIVSVTLIYILFTVIDLLRQIVFERAYMIMANKYLSVWLKPFVAIINFVKRILFGQD